MKHDLAKANGSFPLRRDGPVIAFFLALTALMTNPLVLHLADAVEDKQDALLNTWIIAWVGHALTTDPLRLFDANIFHPYSNTLAFSEAMVPQGLLALPINTGFGNTILGYNLVLLFSLFLAAYAMYLLVFDLTRNAGAAVEAAIVFAFNPYNLSNLAQVQLLSFGWLPLALLFFRRVIRNSQFVVRHSILFALFFSLQALASMYYAFLAAIAIAVYLAWFLIANRPQKDWEPGASRGEFYVSLINRLSTPVIVIGLAIIPFVLPYLQVQKELGFARNIEESEQFSASLKLYSEVSPTNLLYGNFLSPHPAIIRGNYPLDNLFPGFAALVLAIIGILAAKHRERWFYVCLLALAFILSLGPRLFITPTLGTPITLPYRWLYDTMPLVHALRAPVRFDALVMLALAVLAGYGMNVRRLPLARWQLGIGVSIVAFEYLAFPAANITPVPTGDAIPPYVRWLAKQPPATILELPMIASDPDKPLDLTSQYLSTYHWQDTPDGYSGFWPDKRGEIVYEMQFFPNERSISLLRALNVQYIVSHNNLLENTNSLSVDLQAVERFGTDVIYRVSPRAPEPAALFARGYFPEPAAPSQNYWAYVIFGNYAKHSSAVKPTDKLEVQAEWSDGTTQRTTAAWPLVTSSISVVQVHLLAPPSEGKQHVELRLSSEGVGEWALSGEVTVQAGDRAQQVVIPVQIELGASLKQFYSPGETIPVDLRFLARNKINAYYSVSARVVDARGYKIVAEDRQPETATLLWTPESVYSDQFNLPLPRDLEPGEYSIQVLMYQADQGLDALVFDRDLAPRETIELARFTVK